MRTYRPALLGGTFIGVLSVLPYVNRANCCCLWVIAGGLIATYLLQQSRPEPIETAEAMLGGLVAGLVGAVIFLVVTGALMQGAANVQMQEQMRQALDQNPQLPAETRNMMLNLLAGRNVLFLLVAFMLPLYAIFSTLGALLGLALFRKKTPPPAAPAQ
jgi:uncharacterized membrane protein YeaQ/YmgE (transglycosylase-associated protein family)